MLFNFAKLLASYAKGIDTSINFDEYSIYYTFSQSKIAIAYFAIGKEKMVAVGIKDKDSLVNPFDFNQKVNTLDKEQAALLQYISRKESKKDDDTLKSFYGIYFEQIAFLHDMSKEDLARYEKEKTILSYLKDELKGVNDLNIKQSKPYLLVKLNEDYEDVFEIQASLFIQDKPVSQNIKQILDAIGTGKFEDKSGNIYELNLSDFPYSDQQILFILMKQKAYSPRATSFSIQGPDFLSILKYKANEYIFYNGVKYKVIPPIEATVEIQDDGTIHSNLQGPWVYTKSLLYLINTEAHIIQTATLKSAKLYYLLKFAHKNPNFNINNHLDTFANDIIPEITSITKIGQSYIEKTNKYRTAIQLYLDINDDGLLVYTKYIIQGKETGFEEFSTYDSTKYNDYISALNNVGLMDSEVIDDADVIAGILTSDLDEIKKVADIFISDTLGQIKFATHSKINILTHSGMDWFDVSLTSNKYSPTELQEILAGYKRRKKYVRLKDNIIKLDDDDILQTLDNFDISEDTLTTAKLPLYQAIKLKSIEDASFFNPTAEIMNLFRSLANFSKNELNLSPSFKEVVRPYQVDGIKWLKTLDDNALGGILADDMGLGKSLQLIAFFSLVNMDKPAIIVCPKSLIYNWQNEFIKWGGKQNTIVLAGSLANRKQLLEDNIYSRDTVFITSYDSLRNDVELYEGLKFSYCILDEAQYIANALAKKTQAVKSIEATRRFVLTGTPIQNSLVDLWSIFDFLLPGYLDGYKDFKNTYKKLELDDSYSRMRLEKLVAPFILRRSKNEVLKDLPEKSEEIVTISMSNKQQALYDAMYQEALLFLQSNKHNNEKIKMLAYLTRLRQICVDPSTFLENFKDLPDKLDYLVNLIKDSIENGHKLLVFSSFAQVLIHVSALLEEENIKCGLIYGKTSAQDRIDLANKFNDLSSDLKVMLVSLKAGGTGLNLIGADIVVHLDPWWNLAAENQATDRAHRIGQSRPVTIFKLVCKSSIEEKVIELQKKKKALGEIIHEYDETTASFSDEDLAFLLS